MTKASTSQTTTLGVLSRGGRLSKGRWSAHSPWLSDANGKLLGYVKRVTVDLMVQRGWIVQQPVKYGDSLVRFTLTDAGRSALAATTAAPAADTDAAAAETVGEVSRGPA